MTATQLVQEEDCLPIKKYAPYSNESRLKFTSINHQNERTLFLPRHVARGIIRCKTNNSHCAASIGQAFVASFSQPSLVTAGIDFTGMKTLGTRLAPSK
jgi:hypothetical protein